MVSSAVVQKLHMLASNGRIPSQQRSCCGTKKLILKYVEISIFFIEVREVDWSWLKKLINWIYQQKEQGLSRDFFNLGPQAQKQPDNVQINALVRL